MSDLDVQVIDQFADKNWRLWNLYRIIDDSGQDVKFEPNDMQILFLEEMHYLNVILKGRQHGFTTLIDIWMLDECIFYPNLNAGIIAHTLDDVKKIFRRKIKHPWEKLPDGIKASNPPVNDTQNELIFTNGSEINVDTSMRSGTSNMLHVSEFGMIALKFPEKANEIKVGSFNTVHQGNFIFVESTGHGKGGEFYDLVRTSKKISRSGKQLTDLDFKYHFYPWWMNPRYALPPDQARLVVFTRQDLAYFDKVKKKINSIIVRFGAHEPWLRYWQKIGGEFTHEQMAWYLKKREYNGEDMKREYPSTDDEPFEAIIQGAIFGEDMALVRQSGRITRLRHEPALAVHSWWDIGRRDKTAVWFYQTVGNELRFIWFEEESFKGLPHWATRLDTLRREQKWHYGKHLGPHDMAVTEWGVDKTRLQQAKDLGYIFDLGKQVDELDQIAAARATLPLCIFDEENCAVGISHLEHARREWNDHLQMYATTMRHDEHSHAASSFMNGCAHIGMLQTGRARAQAVQSRRYAT